MPIVLERIPLTEGASETLPEVDATLATLTEAEAGCPVFEKVPLNDEEPEAPLDVDAAAEAPDVDSVPLEKALLAEAPLADGCCEIPPEGVLEIAPETLPVPLVKKLLDDAPLVGGCWDILLETVEDAPLAGGS